MRRDASTSFLRPTSSHSWQDIRKKVMSSHIERLDNSFRHYLKTYRVGVLEIHTHLKYAAIEML